MLNNIEIIEIKATKYEIFCFKTMYMLKLLCYVEHHNLHQQSGVQHLCNYSYSAAVHIFAYFLHILCKHCAYFAT